MLELDLEQPHDLDADAGHAGNANAGELVAAEDLLDVALGDHVAGRRTPVSGHDNATVANGGHDRGAARKPLPARPPAAAPGHGHDTRDLSVVASTAAARQQFGRRHGQEITE